MSGRIVVDQPDKLNSIIDVIHDCWFDVESVRMTADGVLEIPFLCNKSAPEALLSIHHVSSFEITDTEKVGKYDFDRLLYDSESQTLRITTGIPLEFQIRVHRLEVTCEGSVSPNA